MLVYLWQDGFGDWTGPAGFVLAAKEPWKRLVADAGAATAAPQAMIQFAVNSNFSGTITILARDSEFCGPVLL